MTQLASHQTNRYLSRRSRGVVFVGVILTLTTLLMYHRQAAVLVVEAQPRQAFHEAYLLPQPDVLRTIGLGHNEMMADLIWLRALSYFAIHFSVDQDYRWLERYIEAVIELDPNFKLIYQWAGVVVMYGGQQIDNRAVMTSNRFLEIGRQEFPDDWLINFMLGCNYRYELIPQNDEQAEEWRLLGATYLRRAADLPEAPAWLALTALRTLDRYGAREEALSVAISAFLARTQRFSATNQAEMALYRHYPDYGSQSAMNMGSTIANGLRLRERLPTVEWWSTFAQRRLLFADLDSASGYLPWEHRVLMRGGPDMRARANETSLDTAFFQTLELLGEHTDH